VERLATEYRRTYPMLRVYRDDLERIVAIFKENFDKVTIEAEGYKLSDISDLDQLQEQSHLETLSQFEVMGRIMGADNFFETIRLYVRLNQDDWYPVLYLTDDSNAKLYGAAAKIDAILSARRRRTLEAVTSWRAGIFVGLIYVAVIVIALLQPWNLRPHPTPDAIPWLVVIFVFGFLPGALFSVAILIRRKYRLIVYLTDSHERKRLTSDQQKRLVNGGILFVAGVASAVISGLILWALTR
jgi:hypothetical protein